jgi:hypothetical protein
VLGPGTPITVRLLEPLSSSRHRAGHEFTAVLDQPIAVGDIVIADAGSEVEGRVTEAERASHFHGLARLAIVLTGLTTADGQRKAIRSAPVVIEGANILGVQNLKTGAATTVTTVVSTVAGRSTGHALGDLVGGVIGTSGAVLTGGRPAELPARQAIRFSLQDALTFTEPPAICGPQRNDRFLTTAQSRRLTDDGCGIRP